MTLNMMLDNAAPEAIAGALTQQHPGLFFTMVEQASVAISLTDASARIIYANPAFCRQTGYSLAISRIICRSSLDMAQISY